MMTRIATALWLGTVLLAASCANPKGSGGVSALPAAQGTRSLEEIVVEMATTPADHAALAEHYRAKAEKARAAMRRHESMGRAYTRGKQGSGPGSSHCKRLSESYAATASDYDDLAKLHDLEAEEAR